MKNLETFEEFLNEASVRPDGKTPDQVFREADKKLKEQISKFSEMIKTKPEQANIFRAQLELANAKMVVLHLKKKLDDLKK